MQKVTFLQRSATDLQKSIWLSDYMSSKFYGTKSPKLFLHFKVCFLAFKIQIKICRYTSSFILYNKLTTNSKNCPFFLKSFLTNHENGILGMCIGLYQLEMTKYDSSMKNSFDIMLLLTERKVHTRKFLF